MSGQDIISIFPDDTSFPVYQFQEYSSDSWNPFDYGVDIENDKTLFSQIQDFLRKTPKRGLNIAAWATMENCDYCNYGFASKDCYMCQVPLMSELCYYSHSPFQSKYNFDCYLNEKCENAYESSYCIESYKIFYSDFVEGGSDCYFCYDIQGSQYCIWCVGISGKQYHIFNEEVTKREYEETLANILSSQKNLESFRKKYENFKKNFPRKNLRNIWSENSYGNTIRYSKDMTACFGAIWLEKGYYSTIVWLESNNLVSCASGWSGSSYVYQTVWFSASNNSAFNCFGSGNQCFYNYDCRDSEHCMFSVGLINQKYCIFNKQYSEKEYFRIKETLIKKLEKEWIWGEFFQSELSLFPYNDSPANDYYPVEKIVYLDEKKNVIKTEVWSSNGVGTVYILEPENFISEAILDLQWKEKIKIKWRTREVEYDIPDKADILKGENIPEIQDVSDGIVDTVILCEVSGRPYRIISQELDFYKKYKLPLPRRHPEIRFQKRFQKSPKNTLYLRACVECKEEVLTAWDKWDIVCEVCYLSKK